MYISLDPKKDLFQQIRNIFKKYKIEREQIATFPSATNKQSSFSDDDDVAGICYECNKKRPYKNWCNPCYSSHFKKSFRKWTSGNKTLDKFIRKSQLSSISRTNCLEWIPKYNLTDIELLSKSDYGSVYSATWIDGFIINWNKSEKCWNRCNYGVKVILKTFTTNNDDFTDFLHEPKAHLNCCVPNARISSFYGFTQDSTTNEYLMVLEHSPSGTLRNFIQENPALLLDWKYRFTILEGIALGLRTIHSANLIHGNLHTGNILQKYLRSNLCDFKFSMKYNNNNPKKNSFNTSSSLREVYGVIPFMAPELLRGQKPTLSSDIYSFGIIMWELSSFKPPFHDKPHDIKLIMDLCSGYRPEIIKETPKAYVSLMKRCWHSDPTKRPTSEELVYLIKDLSSFTCIKKINNNLSEKNLLEINLKNSLKNTHPLAIYSSKLLPTLFTIHNQDDNEDNDQWSEHESESLILLSNKTDDLLL